MSDALTASVFDRRPCPEPVVDAHAHLGPYARFFIPSPDAASMVAVMDRCGVSRVVLSAHLALVEDAARGNELTARTTERHPGRLLGYVVANPHQDLEAELRRWADHPGMVGVKLHPDLHEYPLDGPAYEPVWEHAARTGTPVLTHTWGHSRFSGVELVGPVANRHPDVSILAGHAGAMRETFPEMMLIARECANVYLEICGTFFTGQWLRQMVETVGADRVVYGSDFPFIDMRYSIGRVVFADLPLAARQAVLGGTMTALLGRRPVMDRSVVS